MRVLRQGLLDELRVADARSDHQLGFRRESGLVLLGCDAT
jgi:hypothetical protein